MTSPILSTTFANDYYDDFRESDGFYRMLFKGARHVQPREFTQMQTMLQKQIQRFGDNIFKDGGAVNPSSNIFVDNFYPFVKLESGSDLSDAVLLTTFTGTTTGVTAELVEKISATGGDPDTLYIQYSGGGGISAGSRFQAGETISNGTVSYVVQITDTVDNPATGYGTRVSVGSGDFYTQGIFTYAQAQKLILSKYQARGTGVIGFKVEEDIVTALDDTRLYDNQGDEPNETARGADRARIQLTLMNDSDTDSDTAFVYVANIIDGAVAQANNGREDYNRILDLIAERTKEESGNYALDPFLSNFETDSDSTHLLLNVNKSVGYVNGYRKETLPEKIRVLKPVTTELVNNDTVAANYGNHIVVDTMLGLPDMTDYETVNLVDDSDYASGNIIGTSRVRGIEASGGNYKWFLFDTKMHTGKSFRNVKNVGTSATENAKPILENGLAVLKEQQNNNMFFDLPKWRPSSISAADYTYTVMRHDTKSVSTNSITLTKGTGESFASTSEWIFADTGAGGAIITPTSINTTTGLVQFTSATGPVDAVYLIQKGGAGAPTPYKTKTLTETTVTTSVTADSDGTYVNLGKADVFEVTRVRETDSDGGDMINKFYVDNGQRDNFYDHGRMVLSPGQATPGGNIFVRFKYFAHSGVGDFFCVNSYDTVSDITYATIPKHRQTNGETVELRDVLDFRPTIDDAGTQFTGTGGLSTEIPQNTDLITIDTTYYLPRKDRLFLTEEGGLSYVTGSPSFNPQAPLQLDNSMILYDFELNPNSLNEQDLSARYVDNRRYTMRDIGRLHKEINKVKELATLSILDLEASTLEVLDSNGLSRTKAGFLTDDFRDHRAANVDDLEYRAAIDPTAGIMRPSFREKNVGLIYESDHSDVSNTVIRGDVVLLNYTEELYISQTEASRTENVNPYTLMFHEGILTLSPSTDESRDTTQFALRTDGRNEIGIEQFLVRVLGQDDTSTIINTVSSNPSFGGREAFIRQRISIGDANNFSSSGTLTDALNTLPPATNQILAQVFDTISPTWREYQWGWAGIERSTDGEFGALQAGVNVSSSDNSFGRFATRLFVPRIRAREIRFRAMGLLPNARHWPFFDDIDVSDYVLQNSRAGLDDFPNAGTDDQWMWGFRRNNWNWPDVANRIFATNSTQLWHPFWGTTAPTDANQALISTSNGEINGSFFIPNNDQMWFFSGTKEFKLIDVSTGLIEDAVSYASADYEADGINRVSFRRIPPPPPPPPPRQNLSNPSSDEQFAGNQNFGDPIGQSFLIESSVGAFITKVGAYFKTKDTTLPIQCYISPMSEGYPVSNKYHIGALKILSPDDVNVSDDATSVTYFEFDTPVYLPRGEHCVILKSSSFNYLAYISKVGDHYLGTTAKKITKQPTLGSFFKSQNGSTWADAQWEDLKFDIYRANFDSSGTAAFVNEYVPPKLLINNPILFDSGDATVRVIHPNHGLQVNDPVYLYGVDSDATWPMGVNSIVGERTITAIDGSGYTFEADSSATSTIRTGGTGVYAMDNMAMDTMYLSMDTITPNLTKNTFSGKFTSGKSLAGSETPYANEASYTHDLVPHEEYNFEAPKVVMNEELEANGSYPDWSATIKANLSTSSNFVSPIIDLERCSITGIANLIDKQDSSATSGYNVPLSYIDETDAIGGTHLAKYVTKPVTLGEDAVGLKIIVSANRPSVADFLVYYKLVGTDGNLNDTAWQLIAQDQDVKSDENTKIFRDYKYTVGGLAGIDDPFSTFQVKIVMRSTSSSKVPVFRDFRVVALSV